MNAVELRPGRLVVDGQPRVLLTASVFPFRLPRDAWRSRLETVADLGYHAVDTYVPWNVHETGPGEWDFTGDRDVDHFLDLCAQVGLLVLARPGPYICSEWDGGGLPAWLGTVDGLRLRQHEPQFLEQVTRWFDQIMPLLARHQTGSGGPVAFVQLENELDFFDCDDPDAYLAVLREQALGHGITVPLLACAGQGDLERAAGRDGRLVPAPNLYPEDGSTDIEAHAAYYARAAHARGLPLLVPETNRLHGTLKRQLVAGARLMGPYLQTSGWNPGTGPAVNNWGDPLAFMTHDYDFGGVVRPDGTWRPDAAEGRRLAAVIDSLGSRLAAGDPVGAADGVEHDLLSPPYALRLDGGGELLSLTAPGGSPGRATLRYCTESIDVTVPAGLCRLLVRDLPLPATGASLVLCGGELVALESARDDVLTVATDSTTQLVLLAADVLATTTSGDVAICRSDDGVVRVHGRSGEIRLSTLRGDVHVRLRPDEGARPGRLSTAEDRGGRPSGPSRARTIEAGPPVVDPRRWRQVQAGGEARHLEHLGGYDGWGRYVSRDELPAGTHELVLRGPADLVQVEAPGCDAAWRVATGAEMSVPVDGRGRVAVTTHTWGHSNFDDPRLPSLRLGSLRGLRGALAVTRVLPMGEGWNLVGTGGISIGDGPAPRGWLGGWMTATFPQTVVYSRNLRPAEAGGAALRLQDGSARTDVLLDGQHMGTLTPLMPILWLGRTLPGQRLELQVHRSWGETVGSPELMLGALLEDWSVETCRTRDLVSARIGTDLRTSTLPLSVPARTGRWLRLGPFLGDGDLVVRVTGQDLLVHALSGDEVLGRIWSAPPQGVALRGGRGDYLLVPAHRRDLPLDLLVESVGSQGGVVEGFEIGGPVEPGTGG